MMGEAEQELGKSIRVPKLELGNEDKTVVELRD